MDRKSAAVVVRGSYQGKRVNWSLSRAKQVGLTGSYWIKWRGRAVAETFSGITTPDFASSIFRSSFLFGHVSLVAASHDVGNRSVFGDLDFRNLLLRLGGQPSRRSWLGTVNGDEGLSLPLLYSA